MKRAKKILSVLLASALAVGAMGGCASGPAPASSAAGGNTSGTGSTASTAAPAEDVTLKIMSWHGEQSESLFYKGYKEIADAYTAQHPNVKFEFIFQPQDGYKQLLDTQFIAKSAPDIIHMQRGMNSDYANRGMLYDFSNALSTKSAYNDGAESWIETFKGGSESFTRARGENMYGGIFFVPNDEDPTLAIGQPYAYNKTMWKAAGLDPEDTPETWSEFMEICKKLKDSGSIAFSADNDRWIGWSMGTIGGNFGEQYIDQFFDAKFNNDPAGALFLDKRRIANANGDSLRPDYSQDILKIWKEFSQYWQDGWTGTSYDESANLFFMQKAAMMQIGSWDHSNFKSTIGDTFEWGVFPVPLIDKTTSEYAIGKYGAASGQQNYGFAASKEIENNDAKEQAVIDFLQFLSSPEMQSKYCATALSYSPVEGAEIPDELKGYASPTEKATAKQVFAVAYIEDGDASIWKGYAQDYLTGKIDAETFSVKVAELAKKGCTDYCNEMLKPEGYTKQLADAEAKLADMKSQNAAQAAIDTQQNTIDNLKLRQELMTNNFKK